MRQHFFFSNQSGGVSNSREELLQSMREYCHKARMKEQSSTSSHRYRNVKNSVDEEPLELFRHPTAIQKEYGYQPNISPSPLFSLEKRSLYESGSLGIDRPVFGKNSETVLFQQASSRSGLFDQAGICNNGEIKMGFNSKPYQSRP